MPRPSKPLLAVLVVLLLAGGGALYAWINRNGDHETLTLYGNVDIRQVDLAFNAAGPIAEMLVEEGDTVDEGQLLAVLEKDLYVHVEEEARARLFRQQAVVEKLEAGSRPAEIEQARAAVAEAEANLSNAKRTFDRQKKLLERGNTSQQSVDDARTAYDAARARLETAKQALSLAIEGPREEDIAAARAQLKSDEAVLALAEYRLGRTDLLAPADGVILTRIHEPGAVVGENSPVYTLAVRDPVWVRTYVDQPNLGRVFPGMTARIYTDSFPDRAYEGHVGFISPTAEFTPKSVQTPELRTDLVYRLRVYVKNPDRGLRQGMPVTVILEETPPAAESGR